MADLRALLQDAREIVFEAIPWIPKTDKEVERQRALLSAIDAALAESAPEPVVDRVAWMIERVAVYGVSHGWWVKGSADPDKPENWTQDPNAAATFPTCESAACAIAGLKPSHLRGETAHRTFNERVKPTEHMWTAPPPASPSVSRKRYSPRLMRMEPGGKFLAEMVLADDGDWVPFDVAKDSPPASQDARDAAMHASAPQGQKCADCSMDKEACPTCYHAWWTKRHPNVNFAFSGGQRLTVEQIEGLLKAGIRVRLNPDGTVATEAAIEREGGA